MSSIRVTDTVIKMCFMFIFNIMYVFNLEHAYISSSYTIVKCDLPMSPSVRRSVYSGRSVIISSKGGKLDFHALS